MKTLQMCEALAWSTAQIELSNPGEALTASKADKQPFAVSIRPVVIIRPQIYFHVTNKPRHLQ